MDGCTKYNFVENGHSCCWVRLIWDVDNLIIVTLDVIFYLLFLDMSFNRLWGGFILIYSSLMYYYFCIFGHLQDIIIYIC